MSPLPHKDDKRIGCNMHGATYFSFPFHRPLHNRIQWAVRVIISWLQARGATSIASERPIGKAATHDLLSAGGGGPLVISHRARWQGPGPCENSD